MPGTGSLPGAKCRAAAFVAFFTFRDATEDLAKKAFTESHVPFPTPDAGILRNYSGRASLYEVRAGQTLYFEGEELQ
jgi:hypothetical protein